MNITATSTPTATGKLANRDVRTNANRDNPISGLCGYNRVSQLWKCRELAGLCRDDAGDDDIFKTIENV